MSESSIPGALERGLLLFSVEVIVRKSVFRAVKWTVAIKADESSRKVDAPSRARGESAKRL